jgi:hypothetical protein
MAAHVLHHRWGTNIPSKSKSKSKSKCNSLHGAECVPGGDGYSSVLTVAVSKPCGCSLHYQNSLFCHLGYFTWSSSLFSVSVCVGDSESIRTNVSFLIIQGGSNMTGTICVKKSHSLSRKYLNHFVY